MLLSTISSILFSTIIARDQVPSIYIYRRNLISSNNSRKQYTGNGTKQHEALKVRSILWHILSNYKRMSSHICEAARK